jgi:cytosine deaminase
MGLLLRSATLAGGSSCAGVRLTGSVTADVRVDGDVVAWIDPPGTLSPAPGDAVHDLAGYLLLPGPAEPHAHLDKALLADRAPNRTGDLAGAIAAMHALGPSITRADVLRRARRAAQLYLAHGATAVRTHVDVGGGAGLQNLEALLQLREELTGLMTLQIVALVAQPTTGAAGVANAAALREALRLGADLVGGAPHLDPDPLGAMQDCLEAAAAAGVGVDLHTDETLEPDVTGLSDLAKHVISTGFPYPVTAGHCVSLGAQPPQTAAAVAELVAEAGIGVVTLPQTNLYLQARSSRHAVPRGLTAVRALLDAGVTVAGGGDNLRDPFNPMGRGDPLETASLLVTAAHLSPAEAYTAVSAGARAVMGLAAVPANGALQNGVPAELLAVRATSLAEAVATADADRTVISAGRLAVRTRVTRSFPLASGRP